MSQVQYFVIQDLNINSQIHDNYIFTNIDQIRQITKVLRLSKNNKLIGIAHNRHYELQIIEIQLRSIICAITNIQQDFNNTEYAFELNLYCPMLKNNTHTELILQKCTELGVHNFYFVNYEFSQFQNRKVNITRFNRIITEAVEQSERFCMPVIHNIQNFADIIPCLNTDNTVICLERSDNNLNILNNLKQSQKSLNILIGAEGGFSEVERLLIEKYNILTVSLGSKILRAETATIAICSQLL